ncbi:DUF535 family protein [Tabrizicola sp. BL-A-41-H6]|uniref:DUF535 family protein n=1 Tax=Tabrizicola sp. BL-A-41-H6 TaxID=3421107 RepID=UPI003D66E2BB
MTTGYQKLSGMTSFQCHFAAIGESDPLFFLSSQHYLVRGLTPRERLAAALCHYGHEESAFHPGYIDQVYRNGGLRIWGCVVDGTAYDIRLMIGNDVAYEGGLSLVFHVNGGRVCVLSFSLVPTALVLPGLRVGHGDTPLKDTIHFVTRKQLAQDHAYQAAFNKAFDRTTPAHLCFGALTGLVLAQGHHHAVGIDTERHPSFAEPFRAQFQTAYADFWASFSGRKNSEFGYLIDLPLQLTPLEHLDARRRKRAIARRDHMHTVQQHALTVIASQLRGKG